MPLSGISRRPRTALSAFTFRELLTHKRLAERGAKRGRAGAAEMVARIEAELAARRNNLWDRKGRKVGP